MLHLLNSELFVFQDAPPQYYSSRQTLVGFPCSEQTHIDDSNTRVRIPDSVLGGSALSQARHQRSPLHTPAVQFTHHWVNGIMFTTKFKCVSV